MKKRLNINKYKLNIYHQAKGGETYYIFQETNHPNTSIFMFFGGFGWCGFTHNSNKIKMNRQENCYIYNIAVYILI